MAEKPVIQKRRYLSYLLRLWQESPGAAIGEPPLWRASLERPHAAGRLGFESLADLFAFLERETGAGSQGMVQSDEEGRQPPATPE